jgi:hypothetical protein
MALCKLTLLWTYYFIMNIKIEMEVFIVESWKNFPTTLRAAFSDRWLDMILWGTLPPHFHTQVHMLIHPVILLQNIASGFVQIPLVVKFNNYYPNLI